VGLIGGTCKNNKGDIGIMTETRWLPPNELKSHPANPDFAADSTRENIESVDQGEFRVDPKVTEDSHFTDDDYTIISGHRRLMAARERGWDEVKVEVIEPYETAREERRAVLEHNQYRVMTPGEQVNVAYEYLKLWNGEPVENFPRDRETRDKLGNLFKESGRTIEKGLKVKWAAEQGEWESEALSSEERKVARERWQELLSDEVAFSRAHDDVKQVVDLTESDDEAAPSEIGKARGALGEPYTEPPEDVEVEGPVQASIVVRKGFLNRFLKQITFSKTYAGNEGNRYYHLEASKDGLVVRIVAREQIRSYHHLPKESFEEFSLKRDGPVGVSVPVDGFQGALGLLGRGEIGIDFHGQDDERQASGLHMTDSQLHYWAVAPDERESFEDAPDWLPELPTKGDNPEE
jgi:hypothetical protein